MGEKKPRMAASIRSIQSVLMQEWDPIGVRGVPEAADEYDSYIMPVYQILRERRSENALLDYMEWMLDRMGLAASRKSLRPIAGKLLQINIEEDEPFQ
jgi:hypothetical protein